MKWFRIGLLLALTLAAMRASSWALGLMIARLIRVNPAWINTAANIGAFAGFIALLLWSQFPGEPQDYAAWLFGFAVFAACWVSDHYWAPWRRRF